MKLLALFRNKKYRLGLATAMVVLVVPNFVFAYGILDFGVLILSLCARITGWAGIILNLAIMELVFNMGTILNSSIGESVENAWAVIRDVMNLLFIFSLIYIGFQTILDFGNPRQLLPKLIIAALLVNFSLFFTKFVVDVSNVAAVEIYTVIGIIDPANVGSANPDPGKIENDLVNIGVSGAFMQKMSLKDLISPQNNQSNNANLSYSKKLQAACTEKDDDATDCDVTILVYFLASIIFFLIAAYAFAIGAYMLLWRFVTLIILMIFSPFMFIGMIFPKAQKYQTRWWNTFLSAAFFAPAYFLMLYVGLSISTKINIFTPGKNGMFDAVAGSYAAVDLILNFIIVCAFLLMAVTVGKEMSSQGGKGVLNVMDNIRRRGQRVMAAGALGGGAWALRNTAGRQADKLSESGRLKNLAGSNSKLARWTGAAWMGEQAIRKSKKVADSSFDARNSTILAGAIGMAGGKATDELGKGGNKGYVSIKKDRDKDREDFAEKSLGTVDVSAKRDEYGNVVRHTEGEYVGEVQYKDATVEKQVRTNSLVVKARNELRAAEAAGDKEAQKKAKANLEKATEIAEASAEYSRILGYKKAKESVDKINGAIADAASASLGVLAAFTAGPAVIAAAAKAAPVMASAAVSAAGGAASLAGSAIVAAPGTAAAGAIGGAASLKWRDAKGALHKKYGGDGTKAKKAKKKKEDLKILSDNLKESGDDDKKDEKKEEE